MEEPIDFGDEDKPDFGWDEPDLEEESECAVCGKRAHYTCSQCQKVPYCSRVCQQSAWKEHKKVCIPSCNYCGEPAELLCPLCKKVWYCSPECETLDWKEHKEVCVPVNEDDYKYKFSSELKFQTEDGVRVPCESVHQSIKNYIDNYVHLKLSFIQDRFKKFFNHSLVSKRIPVPDLKLTSIKRENCSIKFVFSSSVKISKRVYQILVSDVLVNPFIFLKETLPLNLLFLQNNYDMSEFSFLSLAKPNYKNEDNLSDPDYQYMFKINMHFTKNGEFIRCNDEHINVQWKRLIIHRVAELNDTIRRRLNGELIKNNKHNMVVTKVYFDFDMCFFSFLIQNNEPLSKEDYRFISEYDWTILTEQEITDIIGEAGEFNFEIEQDAQYIYHNSSLRMADPTQRPSVPEQGAAGAAGGAASASSSRPAASEVFIYTYKQAKLKHPSFLIQPIDLPKEEKVVKRERQILNWIEQAIKRPIPIPAKMSHIAPDQKFPENASGDFFKLDEPARKKENLNRAIAFILHLYDIQSSSKPCPIDELLMTIKKNLKKITFGE